MKTTALFSALAFYALTAGAAGIDMTDPRRALGREGDVRVDAQLLRDSVAPGMPVGITFQIHNLSATAIAIAHKVADASYDEESRTITLVVGSEVPPDGNMPQMVLIAAGEKKVLRAAATPVMCAAALKTMSAAGSRYVQVKIAILRDLGPFRMLIEQQGSRAKQRLSDDQFEQWFEANDMIFLNPVPVHFTPKRDPSEDADARGGF